jgi:uncharacterized protein (DUF1501 family)
MRRRSFIQTSAFASASLFVPKFLQASRNFSSSFNGKILVVVQLSGGNDGLNTIVPYQDDLYYSLRPKLALQDDDLINTSNGFAFNSGLELLNDMYDEGSMAILNSVGYPNPNRSHFRSMDIWHTASDSNKYLDTGWLGRVLDSNCLNVNCNPYTGVEIDDSLSLAMKGINHKGIAFRNAKNLKRLASNKNILSINESYKAQEEDEHNVEYLHKVLNESITSSDYISAHSKIISSKAAYPDNEFGNKMKQISSLIINDAEIMIYYVSLPGFDTHALQKGVQKKLLKVYADAMYAFSDDLIEANRFKDVMVMTFSEFGRRVAENASGGTDHGTANNMFFMGADLKKAGLLNPMADLKNLSEGDLKYQIDFRDVYASVLKNWLNINPTGVIENYNSVLDFI